ncbi:histidine kinase [Methylobacterium sp. Leaf456]|uniref:PAS domain-containing sensor histidine kinase n=1 Tax=Methylobacterium sp. Leaf456 TaxID=1736382 RepID=UPI0007019694|nr:PAS domain-containing sensor histidine kinase [Methylobacterium sp. Leaf456]KQT61542.1 histidine kinase [Methylobacterium sp. Leaf456]
MSHDPDPQADPQARIRELEARLEEAEDTLTAIRQGDFDAVVVEGPSGERLVYTLENADRPYRVLIEQIQEGAFTLGPDGTVLYGNRRFAEMLGVPQERLTGQPLARFVAEGEAASLARLQQEAASAPTRGELRLRGGDDEAAERPGYLSLSRLESGGDSALLCGVLTDLTAERVRLRELAEANGRLRAEVAERERIEEALRQSQKMEAVGQLTGGVAHDFNNLLTVIKSSTDLLKRPDLPEERRRRYVEAISDTVARAAKLTGQLLAFARRQALKPEVFDAGRGVAAVADMVGTLTGARIKVTTQIDPCFDAAGAPYACLVEADPSQFDTALVNMVVNARDAMDGEGTLTIRVGHADRIPPLRTHPEVVGDFVAVSIGDTGSGIAPADINRIFEPFFTTKGVGQGTGLGLSQVFGFAKQSGGDIAVESDVGRGTTFTLFLPRAGIAPTPTEPADEPEPLAPGHGTCVLVVEDNREVGAFATQALAELGYGTVWAMDADQALAELERTPERFDVVFTDVVMPGMNGVDLARAIQARRPDMPVVLSSGYSHVLAEDGHHGFPLLHKPYSVEDLSRILRRAARRKGMRRG